MRIISNPLKSEENFDLWNEEKKQTEYIQSNVKNLKIGQVWKYQEGINIQNEISKGPRDFQRPCVILKEYVGSNLTLIGPISKGTYANAFKLNINAIDYELHENSKVVINGIKIVSHARLIKKHTEKIVPMKIIRQIFRNYLENILPFKIQKEKPSTSGE